MRRFVLILLMIMLPWQALAATVDTFVHESGDIVMHIAEHEFGIAHHHHDDGSSHHDNSDASREHVCDHAGCSGVAVLADLSLDVSFFPASVAPPEFSSPLLAGPDLAGLRRPPRTLA